MFLLKLIFYYFISLFLSSFIHETGHILTAILHGWSFRFIVIGPLRISMSKNKNLMLSFEKDIMLWGGLSSTLPSRDTETTFREYSIILLGGPIFSLLVGASLLPLFFKNSFLFPLILSIISMGMGLATILPIPIRSGLHYNDGYRFFRIVNSRHSGYHDEYALFKLSLYNQLHDVPSYDELKNSLSQIAVSDDPLLQFLIHYALLEIADTSSNPNSANIEIQIIDSISPRVSPYILKKFPYKKSAN